MYSCYGNTSPCWHPDIIVSGSPFWPWVCLWGRSLGFRCYPLRIAEWKGKLSLFSPRPIPQSNLQEVFRTDIVSPDDPTWQSEHIKYESVSPLMTEDAADLVSQVSFFCFTIWICFDAISQLLRTDRDSCLSDITEIKKHPFFGPMQVFYTSRKHISTNPIPSCSNWSSVASRSLTPPWVPRLIPTRQLGVRYREPIICAGDQYTAGEDPLPSFTFRAAPSSLPRACRRRQQVFGALEGCAPFVRWVDGSRYVEEVACHTPSRQRGLKALSRWVTRILDRPVRSA